MKYRYQSKDAQKISKSGVDLSVYGASVEGANVVHESVKVGCFEEFKHTSTFMYYVIKGEGVFVLNDEQIPAKANDLIVVLPNTRIYYFGNMEIVLTVTPAWKEENETHIRKIDPQENPFRSIA